MQHKTFEDTQMLIYTILYKKVRNTNININYVNVT